MLDDYGSSWMEPRRLGPRRFLHFWEGREESFGVTHISMQLRTCRFSFSVATSTAWRGAPGRWICFFVLAVGCECLCWGWSSEALYHCAFSLKEIEMGREIKSDSREWWDSNQLNGSVRCYTRINQVDDTPGVRKAHHRRNSFTYNWTRGSDVFRGLCNGRSDLENVRQWQRRGDQLTLLLEVEVIEGVAALRRHSYCDGFLHRQHALLILVLLHTVVVHIVIDQRHVECEESRWLNRINWLALPPSSSSFFLALPLFMKLFSRNVLGRRLRKSIATTHCNDLTVKMFSRHITTNYMSATN